MEIFSIFFTYAVFIALGFRFSKKFKKPVSVKTWIILIAAALLTGFIMADTRLISLFKFAVYLNRSLEALCLGIITGLLINKIRKSAGVEHTQ